MSDTSSNTKIKEKMMIPLTTSKSRIKVPKRVPMSKMTTYKKFGVTALVTKMEPATENLSSKECKHLLKSHTSNKIRSLVDTGSNGDLYLYETGKPTPFPHLARQVPKSWHKSNGTFQTKERGQVKIKFF